MVRIDLTQNGGDVRNEAVTRIRKAMMRAFAQAATAEGIEYGSMTKLRSVSPARFTAMFDK